MEREGFRWGLPCWGWCGKCSLCIYPTRRRRRWVNSWDDYRDPSGFSCGCLAARWPTISRASCYRSISMRPVLRSLPSYVASYMSTSPAVSSNEASHAFIARAVVKTDFLPSRANGAGSAHRAARGGWWIKQRTGSTRCCRMFPYDSGCSACHIRFAAASPSTQT